MKTTTNKGKSITLSQVIKVLQKEAVDEGMEWTDELNADFSTEVEFLLGLKGRWLLCHIKKDYPYTIRFRLVGEKDYEKTKPDKFVACAKTKLLH